MDKIGGKSDKFNFSSLLMFKFLRLLGTGKASYEDVLTLFQEQSKKEGEKGTAQVLLNKYLNTLHIFGIYVNKNSGYYYMHCSPYKIELTEDDKKALELFRGAAAILPEGKDKERLEEFFRILGKHYDENTYPGLTDFYGKETGEQIKVCEEYCNKQNKLSITRVNKQHELEEITSCAPVQVKYYKTKTCFCVRCGEKVIEVPLKDIKRIEELPIPVGLTPPKTSVVFKIKGRLRRNYRLKRNEILRGIDDEGNLVIVNSGEDLDALFGRLLRYGACCEISAPKHLRSRMIEMITQAVEQYEE